MGSREANESSGRIYVQIGRITGLTLSTCTVTFFLSDIDIKESLEPMQKRSDMINDLLE